MELGAGFPVSPARMFCKCWTYSSLSCQACAPSFRDADTLAATAGFGADVAVSEGGAGDCPDGGFASDGGTGGPCAVAAPLPVEVGFSAGLGAGVEFEAARQLGGCGVISFSGFQSRGIGISRLVRWLILTTPTTGLDRLNLPAFAFQNACGV